MTKTVTITPQNEPKSSPEGVAGHRARLRERFLASGGKGLPDYELLEIVLFGCIARGDVKPLAKRLLSVFGSYGAVLAASPEELKRVDGCGEAVIVMLKAIEHSIGRSLKEKAYAKPVLQSWQAVLDYCRATMGHLKKEQFRIFFLDRKNQLIADELQQEGTVDHTPVYPREVVKRALELGASALILVHNHPSGDTTPSKADIAMTKQIIQASAAVDITVHDHIIISQSQHYSFAGNGLL